MVRRLLVMFASVGLVFVTSAGAADARSLPRFRYAATAVDTPVSDGARYLAFAVSHTRTRVVDTELRRSADLETPVGNLPGATGDSHCRLRAMSAGRILWTCPAISRREPNQLVQDARTHEFLPTPGLADLSSGSPSGTAFSRLGRYWLGGWKQLPESGGPGLFYNLQAGQVRFGAGTNHYGDHHVEDPNWPSLMHPLCAPLRRPRYRTVIPGRGAVDTVLRIYGLFDYQSPYALAAPIDAYQRGDMAIYRCGVRPPVRLDRCSPAAPCTQIVLGAGRVTWQSSRGIRAYSTAAKRSYTWTTDDVGLASPSQYFALTHTARQIFIAHASRLDSAGRAVTWTIRAAPWPDSSSVRVDVRAEIAHFVSDPTCRSIQNERRSPQAVTAPGGYPFGFASRAGLIASISCTDAGPGTYYMAFVSHRAMWLALRRYPRVQRLGLCVLDREMLDDDTLDPLPLGRICRRLHGRLLPLTPGKYGHQAPPMTDDSTCADYLRATRLDRGDYVARQRLFSERRNTRDRRVIATAGKVATVCARAQRRGRARTTRVYLALAEVLGVAPR